jgi:spore maturation protein CgeB
VPGLFSLLGSLSCQPIAGRSYAWIVSPAGGIHDIACAQFDPGSDWHTYTLTVRANSISIAIDGSPETKTRDNTFLNKGRAGLISAGNQVAVRVFKVFAIK